MPGHQNDKVRDNTHENLKEILKTLVALFGLFMERMNNDFRYPLHHPFGRAYG
jgi:hypothetical protein